MALMIYQKIIAEGVLAAIMGSYVIAICSQQIFVQGSWL